MYISWSFGGDWMPYGVTDLFGKEITLATTLLTDFFL